MCCVKGLRGCIVPCCIGIGRYKGEAGGGGGCRCYAGGDEGHAADYVSGYEVAGGRGFSHILPTVDKGQQCSQVTQNGQGVFGDRTVCVDNLPDNGCRRCEQCDANHSQ